MKELVYKTIDGNNPRKKEVSIEEKDERYQTNITKKWTCKYFVKSHYRSPTSKDLRLWIRNRRASENTVQQCHILKTIDSRTGENKIVCKILGEFYVVRGLTAFKIIYVNSLRIHMASMERRKAR